MYFIFPQFILQAKFSDVVSFEKKKEAWGYVADAINAVNSGKKKMFKDLAEMPPGKTEVQKVTTTSAV